MIRNIVFDIGNVLLAWDPHAAFRHIYDTDAEIDRFFAEVGFFDWNAEQDRGRSRFDAVAAARALHPQAEMLLDGYFVRFDLTITERIAGTWALAAKLKATGLRLFAITNWSADLWPVATKSHPALAEMFETTIVSGKVGIMKPDPRIYTMLTEHAGLTPADCMFIDDSVKNVEGARNMGWQAHHFQNPDGLAADLLARGIL